MSEHTEGASGLLLLIKLTFLFIINLTISEIHEILGTASLALSMLYVAFRFYVDFINWKSKSKRNDTK